MLVGPPLLMARHGSPDNAFDVVYAKLSPAQRGRVFPLSITAERMVVNQLLQDHPTALFVFSDEQEKHWHLVNVRYDRDARSRRIFRRIAIGPHERLRTAAERVALLDLEAMPRNLLGLSPLAIQQRHDEAFNVEAVTDEFFQGHQQVFDRLQEDLRAQSGDRRWAHDYALQFLNRLMFLYYVQCKRWLGDDPDFLTNFWKAYGRAKRPVDTFVSEWLNVLFLQAFNKRFQAGRSDVQYLPAPFREALALAPFLNGGLFERNRLDGAYSRQISDARFKEIWSFLERYNFTIHEDTPLDQEVAVDPEMIGRVYEGLVNVSDEADERGEAGIFYTPRVEIDLMCRLALVDYLANHLGAEHRQALYETVFAFDSDDKEAADAKAAGLALWPHLNELLRTVMVVDPACGSGSFLVGMLHVLDDLLARTDRQLNVEERPYERKKRIIGRSLYGVDVMEWAVHVAELRLWLQLVMDLDVAPSELQVEPVLPNLSFKVRPGDSLVQEVGGINMALRGGSPVIAPALKRKITELKEEKVKFYENRPGRKYRREEQVRQAELQVFREVLEARLQHLDNRTKEVEEGLRPRTNPFGEIQMPQMGFERLELEAQREALTAEREQVRSGRDALQGLKDVPFVWDIAFVEVFTPTATLPLAGAGRGGGFDIVIGNPPYVRQERIRDPRQAHDEVTAEDKKAYKAKLARSVYAAWPLTFAYDWKAGRPRWALDGRSDLYIYFYLHGLSLLNPKGAFCFITSNSWLDVGYGKDLQQFLLTRGQVRLVVDNQARRSFARADVNTVIALLGAAQDCRAPCPASLEKVARFVMLTVPFEDVLSPVVWEEVEEATTRKATVEYRVHPARQEALLASGMDPEKQVYAGEKWGGKYLRAPHIYWTILEKGKGKLARLGDIADVRRGFTTGANEFFYLDEEKIARWGIEEQFLAWHLDTPRECYGIPVSHSACTRLFLCNLPRRKLKGTAALEYIRWGEHQGYSERSTCKSRSQWYDLGTRSFPIGSWPRTFFERHICYELPTNTFCSDRFYGLSGQSLNPTVMACLNSTYASLMVEVNGYLVNHGGIDTSVWWLQTLPVLSARHSDIESAYTAIRERSIELARVELTQPDRRRLDESILRVFGLPLSAIDDLYKTVETMVVSRIHKARREPTKRDQP